MRLTIIACRVLMRELSALAAHSAHIVDILWLPQGLHDTPDALRTRAQAAMDQVHADVASGVLKHAPDQFCLGYGLCCNGVVGLTTRDIPLVVPRTDDCIALFLGSQARYRTLFAQNPGTFWLNNGWIETCYPSMDAIRRKEQATYLRYAEQFGEDNADYLMEQDALWKKNYKACAYIDSPAYQHPDYPQVARDMADAYGWRYDRHAGDMGLLDRLVNGPWEDAAFLTCPPRHRVEASFDEGKVRAVAL